MDQKELLALAEAIDSLRENLTPMVAALVNDGFTDQQARIIVTSAFALATGQTLNTDEGEQP